MLSRFPIQLILMFNLQLRDSLEKTTREMHNRGTLRGTLRDEVEDLNCQLRTLRSDLEGALLENRNLKIQHGTERSSWAIQVAEYKTQVCLVWYWLRTLH